MKKPGSKGEHILQRKFNTEDRASSFYKNQLLGHLNDYMRQFIDKQEILFISTADSKGECDASFRSGPAGFVKVVDTKTLIFPEFRGNGVFASMGNISENQHIGMIFIDFNQSGIGLHVNGNAKIFGAKELEGLSSSKEIINNVLTNSKSLDPIAWVLVNVEEAYIHCSKHIPLMAKRKKNIHWGTDDEKLKGGDFFNVNDSDRDSSE
jgi:uncharacterized protein